MNILSRTLVVLAILWEHSGFEVGRQVMEVETLMLRPGIIRLGDFRWDEQTYSLISCIGPSRFWGFCEICHAVLVSVSSRSLDCDERDVAYCEIQSTFW